VQLHSNPNLKSIDALQSLRSIGADFSIEKNSLLTDLNGLTALERIGGSFYVQYNPKLTDISALDANLDIKEVIYIMENTSLKHCAVAAFCRLFSEKSAEEIHCENATGCSTTQEVFEACNGSRGEPKKIQNKRPSVDLTDGFDVQMRDAEGRLVVLKEFSPVLNLETLKVTVNLSDLRFLPTLISAFDIHMGEKKQNESKSKN